METRFYSYLGENMEQGFLLFVTPSFEIGMSSSHFTLSISWLFWEFSIGYCKNED